MGLLDDRVAVVTGAGHGIGRVIALALAREGARTVLAGRSIEALEETAKLAGELGSNCLVVPTDITVADQVDALARASLEAFGQVDVLVNNSGIGGPSAPLWEVDPADWAATMAVNVTGTYLCCRAFVPAMVTRGSGSVVIIGSMTGKRPMWGRSPYAASKMALVGLTRTLATEAGPEGVRVNLISPGPVEGERIEWVIERQAEALGVSVEEARARFMAASPLGRLVPPEDVAAAVVFLASDRAASITGEDLNLSAGVVMF